MFYSPARKGEHPQAHLKDFRGVIHPDRGACPRAGQRPDPGAGFNELLVGGRIVEAGCWAQVRRKFFDAHLATGSPVAKEALDRIGQLYAVEKTINGSPPERRQQRRQLQSPPIAEALAAWADSTVRQLSRNPSSLPGLAPSDRQYANLEIHVVGVERESLADPEAGGRAIRPNSVEKVQPAEACWQQPADSDAAPGFFEDVCRGRRAP